MKWQEVHSIKGQPAHDVIVRCAEGDVVLLAYWDGECFWCDDEIVPDVYEWSPLPE